MKNSIFTFEVLSNEEYHYLMEELEYYGYSWASGMSPSSGINNPIPENGYWSIIINKDLKNIKFKCQLNEDFIFTGKKYPIYRKGMLKKIFFEESSIQYLYMNVYNCSSYLDLITKVQFLGYSIKNDKILNDIPFSSSLKANIILIKDSASAYIFLVRQSYLYRINGFVQILYLDSLDKYSLFDNFDRYLSLNCLDIHSLGSLELK